MSYWTHIGRYVELSASNNNVIAIFKEVFYVPVSRSHAYSNSHGCCCIVWEETGCISGELIMDVYVCKKVPVLRIASIECLN